MRPWTVTEEQALRLMAHLGDAHLAIIFERSRVAIRMKAHRLGVSVRRCGDEVVLDARMLATIRDGAVCPACGVRLVAVRSTGVCGRCHYARLAQAQSDVLAEAEAVRLYDAARQRVSRARTHCSPRLTPDAPSGHGSGAVTPAAV